MRSDEELLESWRQGDRDAGQQLLRRHFDSLYRFFHNKLGDQVDDLIQRTFLATVQSRDRFRKDSSFRTYLFCIARNELFRHFRGRKHEAIDPEQMSVVDLGTSPTGVIARHQAEKLLLTALRMIPVDLQITIELHYWEGMTTAELANVLDIPQGTVKSRLRRAREALDTQMQQLADSAELLRTTRGKFDDWVASVRRQLTEAAGVAGARSRP